MKRTWYAPPIWIGIALTGCHPTECGKGTHDSDGVCVADGPATVTHTTTKDHTTIVTVPNTVTNTNTNTNTVTIVTDTDPVLVPGQFASPMVQLKKMLDTKGAVGTAGSAQSHMHISEVLFRASDGLTRPPEMLYCSYTFGVVNVNDPEGATYMAQGWTWPAGPPLIKTDGTTFQPRAPGCQHLAVDDDDADIVYTAQHGNLDDGPGFLSVVDLNHTGGTATTATLAPVLGAQLEEASTAYEGLDYEGGFLYAGLHEEGLGVYHRDLLTNALVADSRYTTGLTNVWDVQVRGTLAFVCDGLYGLVILDVSDPLLPIELGRVVTGGNARDIELNAFATTAYVATESNGLVIVDVTDPTHPALLSTTVTQSAVVSLGEDNGYLAVAAWNDTRVYDVADPANPAILGATRIAVPKTYAGDDGLRPDITGRELAVDISGDVIYNGDWWTPYTYRLVPTNAAPYIVVPESANLLSFPGDLAVGDSSQTTLEVYNDGNVDLTLYDNWVDNPAFTVTPWQARIPPGGSTTLTLTFTASIAPAVDTGDTGGPAPAPVEEHGFLHIRSDDPQQPDRVAYLVGNMAAISVGDPFPETTGTLVNNGAGDWSYSANASGDVLLLAYFATY